MKCTSFFRQKDAGWSETWYLNGTPEFNSAASALAQVNAKRLPLLGFDGELIGTRLSQMEAPRLSRVARFANMAGLSVTESDIPQMSLLFRVLTASGVARSVLLRGVPDIRIKDGNYFPSNTFNAAITAYFAQLKSGGFGLRIRNRSNQPVNVLSVSGAGLVITNGDHGFANDSKVQFVRTRDTANKAVTKTYTITVGADTDRFTLVGWTTGRTVVGGRVQLFVPIHSALADFPGKTEPFDGPLRPGTRKVGRIFGAPVGRRRTRT